MMLSLEDMKDDGNHFAPFKHNEIDASSMLSVHEGMSMTFVESESIAPRSRELTLIWDPSSISLYLI